MCSGTLSSTRFSQNSCSHSGISAHNGSPRSIISSTFGLETSTGWESIPLRSSLSRVSLSLDTVVVGEVDELEEDVGRLLSCLDGVIEVKDENRKKNSLTSLEPR